MSRVPFSHPSHQVSIDIEHELTAMQGKDKFDFAWYINPKMTVPELFHVQVFWTTWEEE